MLKWQPRRVLPAEAQLPPTSAEFDELECCRKWGAQWEEWRRRPVSERAQLLAHDWEAAMREGYLNEQTLRQSEPKGGAGEPRAGQSPAERVMAAMRRPPGAPTVNG